MNGVDRSISAGSGIGSLLSVLFIGGFIWLCADRFSRMSIFEEEADPAGVASPAPRIDINTASASELAALPGVSDWLAARIVEDRQRNGPFKGLADLVRISGVDAETVEGLRPRVFASR